MRNQIAAALTCGLALAGVCWAGSRSVRDELRQMSKEKGVNVAMFYRGKFSKAPTRSRKDDWIESDIPGAVGHSWSPEGMLSPDGTLAAFPYWEMEPCPSIKDCDVTASGKYFLAIAAVDGSGVRKYPQVVLPSEMCWAPDNSKLAMIAQVENHARQFIILHLGSGEVERLGDGEKIAVSPQCWSPDGKRMAYFSSDRRFDRPGTIQILDLEKHETRDLLRDASNCKKNDICVSPYPTWSPDGEWIAYFQDKAYWAVHPSGEGRKRLFRHSSATTPVQWSPDMRYVVYADCCALLDTLRCMCEIGRIHVRRLSDNEDVEISATGLDSIPSWTWVGSKRPR